MHLIILLSIKLEGETMSQQTEQYAIRLSQPAAGQTVTIPVEQDNMRMALGFEPDPNAVAKNGQNLEFNFEDGGKLVLERYYDHYESKTLPTMVTENGDELTGEDFLASLREDLLTAAGPGAGAGAPGSGSGEYADDPGALIDGINRLGSLGTIYWDRETEVPEAYHGLEFPGGTFGLDAQTSLDGVFSAGVYEDARPYQHQIGGGGPVMPGQIFFTPTLTGTTQVTGIHLSGFHVGSVIEIGQPGDSGYRQIIITSESQVVDFTQADFDGPGVYITPPLNSDADMDITAVVDLVAASSGLTDSINGTFTIVVDAVADLPENLSLELGATELSGAITVNESDDANQKLEGGWAKDELVKNTEETDGTGVSVKVPFTATIQFHDYDDGSESHYALIEVPSGANMTAGSVNGVWTLTIAGPNPDGLVVVGTVTLWFDAAGQVVPEGDSNADYSKEFFQIQVPNGAIEAAGGEYTVTVELESSGADITEDTSFDLLCGSQAVETPSDGELDPGNNTAWAIANDDSHTQTLTVDTVDSTLTLNLGWFAEGGDGTKNTLTGGAYTAPADVDGATDAGKGALIDLSITAQSGSQNEHITQVTFTFDQDSAGIQYNGAPVQGGDAIPLNGTTYTFSISGDTVTITITGNPVTDLNDLGLTIVPTDGNKYSDADIPVSYTVTVTSADTGAEAVFSGNSKVVVDAVADLSDKVKADIDGDSTHTDIHDTGMVVDMTGDTNSHVPTTGWETDTFTADYSNVKYGFIVTVSTTFPDTDGSETHYILVEAKPGWSVDTNNLPTGYVLAVPPTITVNGVDFWQIEVTGSTLGSVTVDVPLLVGGPVAGDQSYDIRTGSYVVENDGITPNNPVVDISANNEYDIANNTAVRTDGTTVTYKIDQITSELKVMTGWASEGGKDYKHESATTDNYNPTGGVFDSTENGSAPITISLSDTGSGSAEVISEVVFTFDASRGALVLDSGSSAALTNNGDGTWTLSGNIGDSVTVYFKPHADGAHKFDYSDVDMQYTVTVKSGEGSKVTFEGTSTVVIDAVADKPVVAVAKDGSQIDLPLMTDPSTGEEVEQTAAKPGDKVTVHGTVSFPDTSGGEEHYVLIRLPTSRYSLDSVAIKGGVTDISGEVVRINNTTYEINGVPYEVVTEGSVSYIKVPVDSTAGVGDFTVDIDVTMADAPSSTTGYQVGFGGLATVNGGDNTASGGDYEFDKGNNSSFAPGFVNVPYQKVDSTLTLNVGSAYENADRDAHERFVDRKPWAAMSDAEKSDMLKDSATLNFTGVSDGESLAGFSFAFAKGAGNIVLGGTFIEIPSTGSIDLGGSETVSYTCEIVNGQVVVTIISEDGSFPNGTPMYFVPGMNYSHTDVNIEYAAMVTDDANGYSKVFQSGSTGSGDNSLVEGLFNKLPDQYDYDDRTNPNHYSTAPGNQSDGTTVAVDAVAQQAEISVVDISWDGATGYDKVPGGQDAKITMEVDLRGDVTDGSEIHTLYVEKVPGYNAQSVTIIYTGVDGEPYPVSVNAADFGMQKSSVVSGNSAMYDTIDLDKALANVNPSWNGGAITVEVTVSTPSGGSGGANIHMGVHTHEYLGAVTTGGDKELTISNNNAWQTAEADIELSSATKPSFTVNDAFYENSNATAHEGTETWGAGVKIDVSFGDSNDELTKFELKIDNPELGELIIFNTPQDYADFVTAVGGLTAGGTDTPYTVLQQFINSGKAHKYGDGDEITLADIKGGGFLDGNDNFTGQIIFMPAENGYSGQDPQLTGTIEVRDTESGQTESNTLNQSIIGDAVAQQPEIDKIVGADDPNTGGVDLALSGTRNVTIKATFEDMDSTTDHYILIEANAGWTITCKYSDGTPVKFDADALETYTVGGVVYYKIPVDPKVSATDPNTGEVSLDVTLKAPGQEIFAHMDGGEYSFDVKAGSTDNDLRGGELTFHNNTAIADSGESISGKIVHSHGGVWTFEQVAPLYEDNDPQSYLDPADRKPGVDSAGTFVIGADNCKDGIAVIYTDVVETSPGVFESVLNIAGATWDGEAWTIDLGDSGRTTISVTLSDAYLKNGGANNDADLEFLKVEFINKNDNIKITIDPEEHNLTVIVDAVADRTDTPDVDATYYKDGGDIDSDAVAGTTAGGDDAVARFTVDANFPDSDGSETHYVLVEMIPAWVLETPLLDASGNPLLNASGDPLTVDTVYLDGKTYYRIDVTDKVETDGSISLDIGMTYTGSGANNAGDVFGKTTDGVTDYTLSVGTMTQENPNDVDTSLQNNISVNLDGEVTLQYSPVTSSLDMTVTPSSTEEAESNFIVLTLNPIDTVSTRDELVDLTISYSPADGSAGKLYYDDGSGLVEIPSGYNGFDSAQLTALANGSAKLVFEQSPYNYQDITFTWSGEIKDTVSGATAIKGGSSTVVMDAVADLGNVGHATEGTAGYEGVESGKDITVTITAEFPDTVNASEQHWVVLEQKSLDYKVTRADIYDKSGNLVASDVQVVTKFDAQGNPYFAVRVPDGVGEASVKFTVTTPATDKDIDDFTLQGGAIVIETTRDNSAADREPDYNNNWEEDLDTITIHTGVVETVRGEVGVTGQGLEGGLCELTFKELKPAYNETLTITLKGDSLADGALYVSDGAGGWILMTPNAPNGVDYVLDGNGKYAYKAADEHASGTFDLKYDATVTDKGSGASKDFDNLTAPVTIEGVATPPVDLEAQGAISSSDGGVFLLTLAAAFPDHDGSEEHYFLVALPDGLFLEGYETVTLEANNDHNLPEGTYYKVDVADNVENVSTVVPVRADHTWDSGDNEINWHAVSEENGFAVKSGEPVEIDDDFAYRTEYVSGDAGFSDVSEALHIYGDDSGNEIIGGSGNDVIYGGSGNDVIYGGSGNDTMSGGDGADIFAWHLDDLGGMDNILDFELGSDMLFFDSLFSEKSIFDMVDDGAVSISITDNNFLTLTIGLEGGTTQVVDITLAGEGLAGTQYAGMVGAQLDLSTQTALLEMMITQVTN